IATISAANVYKPRKRIVAVSEWRVARATLMKRHLYERDDLPSDNSSANTADNTANTASPANPDNTGDNYVGAPVSAVVIPPDTPQGSNPSDGAGGNSNPSDLSLNNGNDTSFEDRKKGDVLKNAFCYGNGHLPSYNAKPSDMIGAMKMSGTSMCYKCVEIRCGSKSIIVKIIDACPTCGSSNDIDLTKSAFRELAPPVKGIVTINWRLLKSCPDDSILFRTSDDCHHTAIVVEKCPTDPKLVYHSNDKCYNYNMNIDEDDEFRPRYIDIDILASKTIRPKSQISILLRLGLRFGIWDLGQFYYVWDLSRGLSVYSLNDMYRYS
ncbi:4050_t:CDS:2, partial [Gigaspora margarita]